VAELEKKTEEVKPAKKEEKQAKKKKTGPSAIGKFFARIGKFFKDCAKELKKIVWYGKKQTINSTILVLIALVVFAAVLGLLDYAFSAGITWLGNLY